MKTGAVRELLVVGGGTAGWIAAFWLNRSLRRLGCRTSLVESEDIGIIGVGEATVPSMVQFVRLLGLNEADFMRRCSATHKLGIRFDGWVRPDQHYWHPFGVCGERINGLDLFHYWLKHKFSGAPARLYSDYSLTASLAEQNRQPAPQVVAAGSYAYHLDATALAAYLRDLAKSEGVRHIIGEVADVALDDTGDISRLKLKDQRDLEADLFIDATGFAGALIEKALEDPWIDWSRHLLCDSACALPRRVEEPMPQFTQSTALSAGWTWQIPLTHRTGTGYVYSSAHIGHDAAAAALMERAGAARQPGQEPRKLSMRIGRRTQFWRRNCVSIGLASGFVEPLESTGIHLIIHTTKALLDYFPDGSMNPVLQSVFNERIGQTYADIRDFIMLHYLLSGREEPFWQDARRVPLPDSLAAMLALYDECGQFVRNQDHLFPETSYFFILTGGNRMPRRPISQADALNVGEIGRVLERIYQDKMKTVAAQPVQTPSLPRMI
jgi:tryptophan halogenase